MKMKKKMLKKPKNNMNDDELNLFKEKLEEEFKKLLSNGEDVRSFLYFPYNFLKFVLP